MGVLFKEQVLQGLAFEKSQIHDSLQAKVLQINEAREVLEQSAEKIKKAKQAIGKSQLDFAIKEALTENIDQLVGLLITETDLSLKIEKYESLANMLNTVIVDEHASVEQKNQSLIDYLETFHKPQSKAVLGARLTLGIAGLALMLALMVATIYLVPLIPFAAAFTWMGLGGTLLNVATGAANIATQIGSAFVAVSLIQKITNALVMPLAKLFNRFGKENEVAKGIEVLTRNSFFNNAANQTLLEASPRRETGLKNDDKLVNSIS